MDTAIVWFRRDLRLHDNETLAAAVRDAVSFQTMPSTEEFDTEYAVRRALPELDALLGGYAHRPWQLSEGLTAAYGFDPVVDYPRLDVAARYRALS